MDAGDIGPAFSNTAFYSGTAGENVEKVVSVVIALMTIGAGIWFIFLLMTGAIGIMNAGGDKQAVADAQKRITTGFIGLVVVISALFIAGLIGTIFGIEILDPGSIIDSL
jgi:hypothetical protein